MTPSKVETNVTHEEIKEAILKKLQEPRLERIKVLQAEIEDLAQKSTECNKTCTDYSCVREGPRCHPDYAQRLEIETLLKANRYDRDAVDAFMRIALVFKELGLKL